MKTYSMKRKTYKCISFSVQKEITSDLGGRNHQLHIPIQSSQFVIMCGKNAGENPQQSSLLPCGNLELGMH